MADIDIASRYTLYKEAQARVVRWLVSTATSCRRSATQTSRSSGVVSSKDLATYTELIVSWKPPLAIPENILELLRDVIIGRQDCADFYDELQQQCEGHRTFIKVLENIFEKLKEARGRSRQKKKTTAAERSDASKEIPRAEVVVNLFEHLQVEDPSEEALGTGPAKKRPTSEQVRPPSQVTLQENQEDDKQFALYALLTDFREMRGIVRETWLDYKADRTSITSASEVTEAALAVMRFANSQLLDQYPAFSDYHRALESIGLELAWNTARDIPGVVSHHVSEEMVDSFGRARDLFCPDAAHVLDILNELFVDSFASLADRHSNGLTGDKVWEYQEPEQISTDIECLYHPFTNLLLTLSPDLYRTVAAHLQKTDGVVRSELLRGLVDLVNTKKLSPWFVSAIQVYFDIHELLEDNLDVAFNHWSSLCQYCKNITDEWARFVRDHDKDELWNYKAIEKWERVINHEHKAMLLTRAAETSHLTSLSPCYSSVDLMRKLPTWTAGMAEIQEGTMHSYGTYFANYEAVCLALAHLYKSCLHAGVLVRKWPDMEWFLEQHSKRKPFVRDVARGGEMVAWLRHLQIALGESPALFASNTRYKSRDDAMRKTKPSESRKTMVESPSELNRIGDEVSARGVKLFHERHTYNILHALTESIEASSRSTGKGERHNTGFSAGQLLRNFKEVRKSEDTLKHFDYFSW